MTLMRMFQAKTKMFTQELFVIIAKYRSKEIDILVRNTPLICVKIVKTSMRNLKKIISNLRIRILRATQFRNVRMTAVMSFNWSNNRLNGLTMTTQTCKVSKYFALVAMIIQSEERFIRVRFVSLSSFAWNVQLIFIMLTKLLRLMKTINLIYSYKALISSYNKTMKIVLVLEVVKILTNQL